MNNNIVLLNHGCGNMASIRNALHYLGLGFAEYSEGIPDKTDDCIFILPGVGSFSKASVNLRNNGLFSIKDVKPKLIGICLGMQLLFDESEEGGLNPGLGLIPGKVKPIESISSSKDLRVPHVGWESQKIINPDAGYCTGLSEERDVYFVHSYCAVNVAKENLVSVVEYGDLEITSCVKRGSVVGFQFHPEKSGRHGLDILKKSISYLDNLNS